MPRSFGSGTISTPTSAPRCAAYRGASGLADRGAAARLRPRAQPRRRCLGEPEEWAGQPGRRRRGPARRDRQEPAQDHPVPARAHRRVPRPDRARPRARTAAGLSLSAPCRFAGVDRSCVGTGGGRGIGRAIAGQRLAGGDAVVVLDRDEAALAWTSGHPAGRRVIAVPGDAADEAACARAADLAQAAGRLAGWVNNAAVFGDAWLDAVPAREVVDLIVANLSLAVTGCATAVRRYLAAGTGGAIVNVSSHQAQRPVRGALPYATAKAGIEGLTRALAVDYGPRGIRVNAVALLSIGPER